MVGLTDPRFFAEKRVQRRIFGLQQFLIFSNGKSLVSFPPLLSLRRSFRFSEETVIEKYSLCPSLTVKFLLDFLRLCWPAYWRFA